MGFLMFEVETMGKVPKIKIQENPQILFCRILKNKLYHAIALPTKFHLKG